MGHSALHLTDQGERFARAGLPRVAARRPGCAPAGVWIRFSAPCAGPRGRSNRSAARRRLKLACKRETLLGPDPNQVTSVLLFAASTSRQLRAVSEGPRRKGKGAKDYYTWLEANNSQGLLRRRVPRLRRAPGPRVRGVGRRLREPPPLRQVPGCHPPGPAAQDHPRNVRASPTRVPRKKTSSSSTITSLNPDGSGRTESRFRVPTRAPRDGRSLGARLDDGKIPGFQCRPLR